MAFPSVAATNTSVEDSDVEDHTVSLPSGIVSGNLLKSIFSVDAAGITVDWPAGWVEILQASVQFVTIAVAYRDADGTEGATIEVMTNDFEQSSHCSYRITGHEDPDTQAPEISSNAFGVSTTPNPGSLTPTGGAKDYLWLAVHAHDMGAEITTTDAFPTSYSNGISIEGANTTGTGVGCAERQLNASSEDPGTFTISAVQRWNAATIAVHPAAPPAEISDYRFRHRFLG